MRVAVSPVVPSDLPPGVAAVVVADEEIAGVYYARALDVPVAKRCADASAALTAAFEVASELAAGHLNGRRLRPRFA
jgi:hypothetical protein